uniref:Uncharacterized protein n=1 Tax=Marinitoga okinawensis TaxID=389480 RepID=A0A9C7GWZ2_9BACT|nr:hypothetical protein [Marinitoga okinawensis]CAI4093953.1 Hypothetical protein PMO1_01 [Marinitoga okinawensis]
MIDDYNLNKLGYTYGLAVRLDYSIRLKFAKELNYLLKKGALEKIFHLFIDYSSKYNIRIPDPLTLNIENYEAVKKFVKGYCLGMLITN